MSEPIDIQNGKVDGDKIYWEVPSNNGGSIQHDGSIDGDEIQMHLKWTDGSVPDVNVTLKRTK